MHHELIAGKYELVSEVGSGGMGTVWRARDRTLHRDVAVKLMGQGLVESPQERHRFELEAKALAQLESPHVVQVYDFGIESGAPYIVMELLRGEDLKARLGDGDRLTLNETRDLVLQIIKGLTTASAAGIVHRDLKPANVFLVRDGLEQNVKLLDFGVAWVHDGGISSGPSTASNKIVGTPIYMCPEQLRGYPPHPIHDLWSLAVIAYRALTGTLPFYERHVGNLIVSICTDPFEPPTELVPGLPPAIDAFFERALAKQRSQRYSSALEFVEAFSAATRPRELVKILVVDDEPDMAQLVKFRFRKQLRSKRYQISFARDGQAGLEALRKDSDIDVVLSDINMPTMDGLTFLAKVPEVAPLSRVVMVSAYGDMNNIRRAMNAGAFDFVVKPIDFGDLELTIEKTARVVREHREMVGSDEENRILRKLAPTQLVSRLGEIGANVALATEADDATLVCLRPVEPANVTPAELIRGFNAVFEVIVPEIDKAGGLVDSYSSDGVLAAFFGKDHMQRALSMCVVVSQQLASLARLAGADSPYVRGLAGSVASGRVVAGCVGSQTSGRLGYTLFGPAVDVTRKLARVAEADEILVDRSLSNKVSFPLVFTQPRRSEALECDGGVRLDVLELEWRSSRVTHMGEATMEMDRHSDDTVTAVGLSCDDPTMGSEAIAAIIRDSTEG